MPLANYGDEEDMGYRQVERVGGANQRMYGDERVSVSNDAMGAEMAAASSEVARD